MCTVELIANGILELHYNCSKQNEKIPRNHDRFWTTIRLAMIFSCLILACGGTSRRHGLVSYEKPLYRKERTGFGPLLLRSLMNLKNSAFNLLERNNICPGLAFWQNLQLIIFLTFWYMSVLLCSEFLTSAPLTKEEGVRLYLSCNGKDLFLVERNSVNICLLTGLAFTKGVYHLHHYHSNTEKVWAQE